MENRRLDLISCYACHKKFNDMDEVCSIKSERYSVGDANFLAERVHLSANLVVDRIIRFHKTCFSEMAGNEYVP